MDTTLPKKIWFLWLQGLENAPLLVRKCHESWLKYNPDWEIVLLTEDNLQQYVDTRPVNDSKQIFSDAIRIDLLTVHGGVWVDATCFCTKPLDGWLFNYMTTGFFAFDRPGPDRMISSWFLASTRHNYISATFHIKWNTYWAENPGMQPIEQSKWRWLNKRLQKMGTQIWFSNLTTKILKVYPYFCFHYLFEQLYLHDENFKEMWDDTQKLSADIPHSIFLEYMYTPINEKIKEHIDNRVAPLYKLTWKEEPPEDIGGTTIGYLFSLLDD